MSKRFLLLGIGVTLLSTLGFILTWDSPARPPKTTLKNSTISLVSSLDRDIIEAQQTVEEIDDVHCKFTEKELLNQKLTKDDLKKVRAFCQLSRKEKESVLQKKFLELRENKSKNGRLIARDNSYSCFYGLSLNYGIPNYADLGLTSSSCSWHDSNPLSCKNEAGVACLWGCTNTDPVIGWHTKWFASTTDLEKAILPKGYVKISNNYGGDYSRAIGYGYRWQIHPIGGGWWHSEGPEPNPAFNWYAFLRDWWPLEVQNWHNSC